MLNIGLTEMILVAVVLGLVIGVPVACLLLFFALKKRQK
jgi:hypothetical protein